MGAASFALATVPALAPGPLNDVVVTNPGGPTFTAPRGYLADFLDVPGAHPFHRFVEILVRRSITGGCGAGRFCPAAPVTREQMAVFLLTSKEPAGYVPPALSRPSARGSPAPPIARPRR